MNTAYLFEIYESLMPQSKLVFLDVINGILSFIKVKAKFKGTITEATVEGTDIIIFTYKNTLNCGKEVRQCFDISNSLELSTLALIRVEVMEILESGGVIQKLRIDPKSQAFLEEMFGMSEKNLEGFYDKDSVTGKYIFNPNAIKREGDQIIYQGVSKRYDELDDETKQVLKLYDKIVLTFGITDLSHIANLDESYFRYDLFLTSGYNLSKLRNILISDDGKDVILDLGCKDGALLINKKVFHLEPKKRGTKAIEFLSLLSRYFSLHETEKVTLTELIDFKAKENITFKELTDNDIANSRYVNSYLETIHDNLWNIYGGNPIIFQKKSTFISLKKVKKDEISPSPEAR